MQQCELKFPAFVKQVLYLEVVPSLKARLRRLADLPHRNRSLSAEAIVALHAYVTAEEAKEGLAPIEVGE